MRKLNDKQREMIQENHALIYYVAGQLGVNPARLIPKEENNG